MLEFSSGDQVNNSAWRLGHLMKQILFSVERERRMKTD
jgi:hypothetical protein